jgi:antitoxin (DNA-binding transcriptional repressor) of toxin-antitoxin stability system
MPNTTLGVEAARRRLPELLERAAAGERIVIQRHRTPMAALVPLAGQAPVDPLLRQRQIQSLMALQGSGRGCWDPQQRQPARPAPPPPAFVQPVQNLPRQDAFNPRLLAHGCRIALDGTALVAFLADAKGAGTNLRAALVSMASKITVGDGKSPDSRKAFLLILSDGVEGNVNEYERNGWAGWRTYGNWTPDANLIDSSPGFYHGQERSQAVDPTMCNAIKASGVTVLTLHTEYLTPVGTGDYRFQQIQSQLKPVIATRLRDCASGADLAFNASSPAEIKAGTLKMLAAVIAKAHLVN